MTALYIRLSNWRRDEEGATGVEYALLIALIAMIIVTTVGLLGEQVNRAFNDLIGTF